MHTLNLEELVNKAIDLAAEDESQREYIGASIIGSECERAIWYGFRWYKRPTFPARIRRRFLTGDYYEERVVERLRYIGLTVDDTNPRARNRKGQWAVEYGELGGILRGHLDGIVTGHGKVWQDLGAELDQHHPVLLEVKAMASAKYKYTDSTYTEIAENKRGETLAKIEGRWFKTRRRGVLKGQVTHYAQMQAYMGMSRERDRAGKVHYAKWGLDAPLDHALYVAVNTDTEEYHAELVAYSPTWWERIKARAIRIIRAATPPARKSENPADWTCRFCDHSAICHDFWAPERSCRSCSHATLRLPGDPKHYGKTAQWVCTHHGQSCGDYTPCDQWSPITEEVTF